MKTFLIPALISVLGISPHLAGQSDDDAQLVRLLQSHYNATDYTAHIRINEVVSIHNSELPGHISFEVSGSVLETFKGEELDNLVYQTAHKAPSDGPASNQEVVVSLKKNNNTGILFVPDSDYVFEADPPTLRALRDLAGETIKTKVTCTIPSPPRSLNGAALKAHLYAYDPRLADAAATEVDEHVETGIDLEPGRETTLKFSLSTFRQKNRSYYVTIFVHPDAKSEDRLYYIDGFQKVLENKDLEELEISLFPPAKMKY